MCGVAGSLGGGAREALEAAARQMSDALLHRGPDDSGVWVDAEAGVALGHRRLSIQDLSPAGHQPMVSASGRRVLVFNGEIYNQASLRERLRDHGIVPAWRGHSDTETLVECVEAWGVERTLELAVGMFALALWERDTRTLVLARDRMGEKPMYYGWQRGQFLFGSELRALRAHPAFGAQIDRGALALLLRHNYVPAPHTIYEGIFKLPAGSLLRVTAGQADALPVPWWSLQDVAVAGTREPFRGSEEDAVGELERLLGGAVRGQMIADVPLGALLSGGLDSSLVAAMMQANSERPIRTFTIGFDEREYDEATHARAVAAHLGTEHTELRLSGSAALDLVPQLPSMYDEPFADSSQLPTHLVMKLARAHVTVALSGDAGDEMFGGYNRYIQVPKVWKRTGWMPRGVRRVIGRGLTAIPSRTVNRWAGPFAQRLGVAQPGDKAHKLGVRLSTVGSIDDLYVALVSEWKDQETVVLGAHAPLTLLDQRSRWPDLQDPVARMMGLDALTYLPDDILVKVDRAAMAVSLETRAPFLDRDLIEFAWTLPMHMKIRDGKGKWLLRRLLHRHVPAVLTERPKMGFAIPLDDWLRGPLRDWADALLDETRLRQEGYFEPRSIADTWHAHRSGRASHGYRLWSVLMFQAWLETVG